MMGYAFISGVTMTVHPKGSTRFGPLTNLTGDESL
jgi:hypothetical protein